MTTEDFYNKENYSSKISKDFNYTVPIDTMRTNTRIYEYLCCLEECNQFFYDNLPQKKRLSLEEFEEELSKGITLLQILSVITPVTKIHQEEVKSYKHMDNIVLCTQILTKLIPKFFNFEPIDLYERKNIPKVIYAIHALASIYAKCFDVKIKELFGKVNFDSTEISRVEKQIKENKINLKDKREIKNELKKEQDSEKISEFLHEVVKKEERKGNSKEIFEFIKLRSYQLAHRDIFKRKEPSIHTLRKVLPLFVRESVYVKKEKNLQESEITLKELKMHKLSLEEEIFKLKNKILVLSHNRNKSLEKIISLNSDTKKIQEIINLYLKDHSIKEIINLTEEEEKVILKKEEINKIINYFHTNQKYLEINEIQEEMFIPVDLNYCTNGIKHKVLVLMLISRGKNLSSLLLNCDEKDYEVQKKNFDLQQSLPEFLNDLRNEFSKFYKHLKKINKVTFPSHDIDKIFKFVIELLLEDLLFLKLSKNEREKEDLILKRKNEEISKEITELSKKKESYLSLFNEYLTYVFKKNVVDEREEGYGTFKAVINGKDFVMKCAEKDVIVLQRNNDKVTFLFSDILLRLYSGESVFYFYEEEIFLKEIVEVINLCYVY